MTSRTFTIAGIALLLAGALVTATVPTAAAETEPDCMQVYFGEYETGPVTVDASDSCPEITIDEDWEPTTTDQQPKCYQIYLGEYEVGPATVDASDSCVEVRVDQASSTQSRCYQVYIGEYEVGPATVDASDTCVEVTVDEDWRPTTTNSCLAIFIEINAGPATYQYNCGGELTVDEDYNPATDDDNLPEFCTVNFEESVGPATVSDTCEDGDAVQATTAAPADHTQPADPEDIPKCVLTADDGTERFMCVFGPPGP